MKLVLFGIAFILVGVVFGGTIRGYLTFLPAY